MGWINLVGKLSVARPGNTTVLLLLINCSVISDSINVFPVPAWPHVHNTIVTTYSQIKSYLLVNHIRNTALDIKIDPNFEETVRSFYTEHDIRCDPCRLNEGNQDPLNAVISREEIVKGIESIKNCKAPGEDVIVIEMMKAAKIEIVPHLQSLFNKILESRNYPDDWCKAILCPLHKYGTTCNVDNYRGMYLFLVVSKIFTKILNERFISWAKENVCLATRT